MLSSNSHILHYSDACCKNVSAAAAPPPQNGGKDLWVSFIDVQSLGYSCHYVFGVIGVYADTLFTFFLLGPRTLCNACGLVWAKVVRFYVILLCAILPAFH